MSAIFISQDWTFYKKGFDKKLKGIVLTIPDMIFKEGGLRNKNTEKHGFLKKDKLDFLRKYPTDKKVAF